MDIVINGRFLTQHITGVQRYARELLQALDEILDTSPGIKVTVLTPRLSSAKPNWRNIALRQVGRLQGHAWEQFELPWYSSNKTLFCPGNVAPLISLLLGQRVIVTVHDLSYRYFPSAYRLSFRLWYGLVIPFVFRRALSVITVSESERKAILNHFPEAASRLKAIANGGLPSSRNAITRVAGSRSNDSVLYVGSQSRRKNFPRILKTACDLARRRGFNFIFVGGESKSLNALATKVPDDISSRIVFVGAVDDMDVLISYYQRAACLLFPSLYESSGLPPIEAMACGCPVIVSDIPALRERCGDAAVYCNPEDIHSITAAIEGLMDRPDQRQELQDLGYLRSGSFTWKKCARETLELIVQSSLPARRPG
jgi:glycosyltransferase involved in cell wall biosynthesis